MKTPAPRFLWHLLGPLAVAALLWLFFAIASEVTEGETRSFDEAAILALRTPGAPNDPLGPRWLEEMVRDITALGGVTVLTLVVAAVIGYLLMQRQYRALVLTLVSTLGGWLLSSLLKAGYARPRPSLVSHAVEVTNASFPSGHSMMSAVVYLTLAVMLTRLVSRRRLKIYFLTVALLLTFLIGVSRVYLGVHYPTDVLAGWTLGLGWALACGLAADFLAKRGVVQEVAETTE